MDYEKKYNEVLKSMRVLYNEMKYLSSPEALAITVTLEDNFPELKETEDEKIKKMLIRIFKKADMGGEIFGEGITYKQVIAWLEKQGQEKSIDMSIKEKAHQIAWEYSKHYEPLLSKESWCEMAALDMASWLEKQGEQKSTDKVEPKFKKNDWITNGACTIKITSIDNRYYWHNNDCVGGDIESIDKEYHLWTIKDARDGDVLATEKGNPFIYDKDRYNNGLAYYYAGLDVNKELTLKSPHHMLAHFGELYSVSPATKEQRDLLFQKMKEAGYEWDAEKKELKKIEQLSTYWSEEDEEMFEEVCSSVEYTETHRKTCSEKLEKLQLDWLKSLKDRVQLQPKQEWSEEDEKKLELLKALIDDAKGNFDSFSEMFGEIEELNNWLKSIIKFNHWKPSEYDISLLEEIARNIRNNVRPFCSEVSALEDLIENLRQL